MGLAAATQSRAHGRRVQKVLIPMVMIRILHNSLSVPMAINACLFDDQPQISSVTSPSSRGNFRLDSWITGTYHSMTNLFNKCRITKGDTADGVKVVSCPSGFIPACLEPERLLLLNKCGRGRGTTHARAVQVL